MRGLAVDLQSPGSSGTASLGIALNVPKARALTPALNVSYDSGGGNGPYGAGVSIAIASISRSTATGVPSYTGADVLVFSETGVLVEKGHWNAGRWTPMSASKPGRPENPGGCRPIFRNAMPPCP